MQHDFVGGEGCSSLKSIERVVSKYLHSSLCLLLCLFTGEGLSFIRATLLGILAYHFEKQSLDMAIAGTYVGFCTGWLIVSAPASYLFTKYGFNNTMFLVTPLMLVHLLGVVFYSQDSKTVAKKDLPESVPLKESLKQVLTDVKVIVNRAFSQNHTQID